MQQISIQAFCSTISISNFEILICNCSVRKSMQKGRCFFIRMSEAETYLGLQVFHIFLIPSVSKCKLKTHVLLWKPHLLTSTLNNPYTECILFWGFATQLALQTFPFSERRHFSQFPGPWSPLSCVISAVTGPGPSVVSAELRAPSSGTAHPPLSFLFTIFPLKSKFPRALIITFIIIPIKIKPDIWKWLHLNLNTSRHREEPSLVCNLIRECCIIL